MYSVYEFLVRNSDIVFLILCVHANFARHKFMVSIDGGVKVYQGVDILGGKPVPSGWKQGRIVQRPHRIRESAEGVFVVRFSLPRCKKYATLISLAYFNRK